MRKNNLLVVDVETTGLRADANSCIELGAILTTPDFKEIAVFQTYIKPHRSHAIEPKAMEINGLDVDWLVSHAPRIIHVANAFNAFIQMSNLPVDFSGFNCPFDIKFCTAVLAAANLKPLWSALTYDCMVKSQRHFNVTKISLAETCSRLGVSNTKAHSAISDARSTIKCMRRLAKLESEIDNKAPGQLGIIGR